MPTLTKTTVGLNLLRDANSGANTDLIVYVAIGSGTATPSASDTQLQSETFRKRITTFTNGGTGELLAAMYLAPNDAVGMNIQEVAVFCGPTATSAPNSGILLGRCLYSLGHLKTILESVTLQLDLTYS